MYDTFPKMISDACSVTNLEPHGWGNNLFSLSILRPSGAVFVLSQKVFVTNL